MGEIYGNYILFNLSYGSSFSTMRRCERVGADPRVCPFEWIADSGQTDRCATLLPEGRADTGGCPYSWLQVIKHPIYGHKTLHYGRPLSRGSKSPL